MQPQDPKTPDFEAAKQTLKQAHEYQGIRQVAEQAVVQLKAQADGSQIVSINDPGNSNVTDDEIIQKAQRYSRAIQAVLDERNRVLQTLDEQTIKEFFDKHEVPYPSDLTTFWVAIHKTITGIEALPLEFRRRSDHWLRERKFATMDDGDR